MVYIYTICSKVNVHALRVCSGGGGGTVVNGSLPQWLWLLYTHTSLWCLVQSDR